MAHRRSDDVALRFAVVEVSVLGIPSVKKLGVNLSPYVQIFRNGRCVASFSTGPAHNFATKTGSTLDLCTGRTPQEWSDFETEFAVPIQGMRDALESIFYHNNDDSTTTTAAAIAETTTKPTAKQTPSPVAP